MKQNIFSPFNGIQDVKFGMSREEVRTLIGSDYIVFKRGPFAENTTDYVETSGVFYYYDVDDKCEAIEFDSESNLYWQGSNLLDYDYPSIRQHFDKLSTAKEEEAEKGITYHDLGFAVTKQDGSDKIEAISIFSSCYW